jgi:hypothetical protein
MPCANVKAVLASASAWAVRPSAASARSVAASAVFLPAVVTSPMASLFGKLPGQPFSKFGPQRYFARISRTHPL